jgi:hypothetical protein
MTILNNAIGEDAYKIIEIGRHLLSEPLAAKYKFVTQEELKESLEKSPKSGNQIYWMELFYRCHMSSYSGLKRLLDWVAIIEQSSDNFIAYCSGLRGLMECAGDTYDGLSAIAITLGENKELLKNAIEGNLGEIAINQELEEKLIHFTHASKPYSKETGLNYHKPKQAQEYVKALEAGSSINFYDYYGFLCELAHPAGTSLGFNFEETSEGEMIFNPKRDSQLVSDAINRDKELIIELLMRGFNPITLLIKTMNLFQVEDMFSKYADGITINFPAWKRINK